jgi:hypothetical protein
MVIYIILLNQHVIRLKRGPANNVKGTYRDMEEDCYIYR